jgi:hypothetical protein
MASSPIDAARGSRHFESKGRPVFIEAMTVIANVGRHGRSQPRIRRDRAEARALKSTPVRDESSLLID